MKRPSRSTRRRSRTTSSPRLYGQFAEFMYQNIKFGLHAELLRDRGFEEPANAIGLPRYWERDPRGGGHSTETEVWCPAGRAGATARRSRRGAGTPIP